MSGPIPLRVYLHSLGCAKNLVESEVLAGVLAHYRYRLTEEPLAADIIIINTCGFIEAAKQESIAAILDLAQYKERGVCRLLLVMGCMAGKYGAELREALPEIDELLVGRDYRRIDELLARHFSAAADALALRASLPADPHLLRRLATPPYLAYLKISEGCRNRCSYCLIPDLRGPLVSRPLAELLAEAESLTARGVKELVVVAQDICDYGRDLDGHSHLPELLRQLAGLPLAMIRLLYAYPTKVSEELLQVMAESPNICPYLDIPLQHANGAILRAMRRSGDRAVLSRQISLIRDYLPDIALRTTMMVGFPGETEQAFAELLDFVAEQRFDWLGAFAYSAEEDTAAAKLPGQIAPALQQQRLDALLGLQATITEQRLQRHLGRSLPVLVEGPAEQQPGFCQGRSCYQAPEVDGLIYFRGDYPPGTLVPVRINETMVYDLQGIVEEDAR